MASRDPRADIVENNPFPKPTISRIHSNQDSSNSTIYTMDDLKSMFTNKTQKKPQLKQVWEFSDIEKQNLLLATAAFALALGFFAVRGIWSINSLGTTKWILMILISMPVMIIAVGPAFVLHEIGHKIIAKKYGCWAEFRADPNGLKNGILLVFLTGFLFMNPGAVYVNGLVSRRQNGYIAIAGPLTNLSLFIIGIPIWVIILGLTGAFDGNHSSILFSGNFNASYFDGSSIIWQSMLIDAATAWLWANLILGLFNMFPFGPLDGVKVKDWNEQVFYGVFLIFLIPVLGMLFGSWSPTALLENLVKTIF